MTATLFDEQPPASERVIAIDSLDVRIDQFLHRWVWRTSDKALVRQELDALIAYAKDGQATA